MTNKDSARRFLELIVARRIREAYDTYTQPHFIHHNQYVKGGRESLIAAMEDAHRTFPETTIDFKHLFVDGDHVISHSHVKHTADSTGIAVVHIFRFDGMKIAELWDLGQQIEGDGPNENGIF